MLSSIEDKIEVSRKRNLDHPTENMRKRPALSKLPDFVDTNKNMPSDTNLSTNQIKQMMANAQKEIGERKRKLEALKSKVSSSVAEYKPNIPAPDSDRARKIAELQQQIRAKIAGGLSNVIQQAQVDKPKPLILDADGRTVDISGREINVPTLTPTLKANIRAKKKESIKSLLTEKQVDFTNDLHFFDERITIKMPIRNKRALRFHEPGKFQQVADRLRMKAQLEKLQNEISQIARKTGISSATKLALIAPKPDTHADDVPAMEWWDTIVTNCDYEKMDCGKISVRENAITNLIEHPTQMRSPSKLILILR
jgi:U4/U6 small nuclear ribonucleoprotein PRP3